MSGAMDAARPGLGWDAEPDCCWAANWSVTTFVSAAVPHRVRFLVSCVVMATTATVVMNRASTRPLTARKAALGSSARRRAAISVLGRLVHRAMPRAAAMVRHGPAMKRPRGARAKLDADAGICPRTRAGRPRTRQEPRGAEPRTT